MLFRYLEKQILAGAKNFYRSAVFLWTIFFLSYMDINTGKRLAALEILESEYHVVSTPADSRATSAR